MSVIASVGRTVARLARGRPHDRAVVADVANAVAAMRYLAGRKLGVSAQTRLQLGYGGRRHSWPLTRREDLTVLEEVFLDEDYAMEIPPPAVILDLGANFGAASVYFTLRWPAARIIAVEPAPELFARLRETTAAYPNITCLPYAVGARDGKMPFGVSESSVGSGFFLDGPDARTIEVDARALASLMAECGIDRADLVKFDVEGAESLMFEDPSVLDRIDAFVGEFHPDLVSGPIEALTAKFAEFETRREPLSRGRFIMRGVRARQ